MRVIVLAAVLFGLITAVPAQRQGLCTPVEYGQEELRQTQLGEALVRHLQGKGRVTARQALVGLADCLDVSEVQPGEPDVAVVRLGLEKGYVDGYLIYRDGGRWVVTPMKVGDGLINPVLIDRRGGRRDLIASWQMPGSGGYGRAQLYRMGPALQRLWESPLYEKFRLEALSPDWLTAFYRPPGTWDEPHATMANCCLPVDGQTLWQREGDRFVERGTRIYPNPYRAVSLFVGALRKGDRALAGQWATGPEVVAAAEPWAKRIDTSKWSEVGWFGDNPAQRAEMRWWEAIPPELRGPKPYVKTVVWPSGPVDLATVRREDGQWRVAFPRAPRSGILGQGIRRRGEPLVNLATFDAQLPGTAGRGRVPGPGAGKAPLGQGR